MKLSLNNDQIVELAKTSLILTGNSVINLSANIGHDFVMIVQAILARAGRVCFCGVGKTGHIARKSAATFCSIGISSYFLHAAEAVHGDLGAVAKEDIVIILSQSGESNEIKMLLPFLLKQKNQVIAISFNKNSYLVQKASLSLILTMNQDLCPHQLVPTISISLFLSVLDVFTICLMKANSFTKENFAVYHPAGNLGRKLLLSLDYIMYKHDKIPFINVNDNFYNALAVIMNKRLGFAVVVDNRLHPMGIIEATDIEHNIIAKKKDINTINIKDFMTNNFVLLSADLLAVDAKQVLEDKIVNVGIITSHEQVVGVCSLQDLLKLNLV